MALFVATRHEDASVPHGNGQRDVHALRGFLEAVLGSVGTTQGSDLARERRIVRVRGCSNEKGRRLAPE
jgi:hypothetical protein